MHILNVPGWGSVIDTDGQGQVFCEPGESYKIRPDSLFSFRVDEMNQQVVANHLKYWGITDEFNINLTIDDVIPLMRIWQRGGL